MSDRVQTSVKKVGDAVAELLGTTSNVATGLTKTASDTATGVASGLLNQITASPVLYSLLAVFLAFYGPRLHPKLPNFVRNLFNNNIFRFAVILLIIYISNRDLQMALIITIGFLLITSLVTSQSSAEEFISNKGENFSDFDTLKEFYEEEFKNKHDEEEGIASKAIKAALGAANDAVNKENFDEHEHNEDGMEHFTNDEMNEKEEEESEDQDDEDIEGFYVQEGPEVTENFASKNDGEDTTTRTTTNAAKAGKKTGKNTKKMVKKGKKTKKDKVKKNEKQEEETQAEEEDEEQDEEQEDENDNFVGGIFEGFSNYAPY